MCDVENRLGTVGGADDIKRHPFFEGIDWDRLHLMDPPYKPRRAAACGTRSDTRPDIRGARDAGSGRQLTRSTHPTAAQGGPRARHAELRGVCRGRGHVEEVCAAVEQEARGPELHGLHVQEQVRAGAEVPRRYTLRVGCGASRVVV